MLVMSHSVPLLKLPSDVYHPLPENDPEAWGEKLDNLILNSLHFLMRN